MSTQARKLWSAKRIRSLSLTLRCTDGLAFLDRCCSQSFRCWNRSTASPKSRLYSGVATNRQSQHGLIAISASWSERSNDTIVEEE